MARRCLQHGRRIDRVGGFCAAAILAAAGAASASAGDAAAVPLVITQLPVGAAEQAGGPRAGGMLRADFGDGARLCLLEPAGRLRVLSEGFAAACDPSLSFDAKRLLFAGKRKGGDPWDIFEMELPRAGGGAPGRPRVRQITRGAGNCRRPVYQSTLYTITSPQPWYQVTFVSDAAGAMNEWGPVPATDLYSCRLAGTGVRRLTYNISSDGDPFLLDDGRLLLASWRRARSDDGLAGRVGLFGLGIDGADYAAFCIRPGLRIKHMPCATPGGLVVFVEADRLPWDGAGRLAAVSLRRPRGTYRAITRPGEGLFCWPAPLKGNEVLVAMRPADGTGTHGIWRVDAATGRRQRVFDDPGFHDIQAVAVAPRVEPDGRSSVVSEKDPNGVLYCLNAYLGEPARPTWVRPGTLRRVRILEGLPLAAARPEAYLRPDATLPAATHGSTAHGLAPRVPRRILGEAPIHPDGSFHVRVPANVPIELQVLDANGMALRTCGWIWARGHEPRGCIGCHEDGELTPENTFQKAFEAPPVPACPPPAARRTVEFRRDVMPLVEARCIGCHGRDGAPPRLDGGGTLVRHPLAGARFNRAYEALLAVAADPAGGQWRGRYVHPGRARTSPLIRHIFGVNPARPWDARAVGAPVRAIPPGKAPPLTEREKLLFVEWIDLGAIWSADAGGGAPAGRAHGWKGVER